MTYRVAIVGRPNVGKSTLFNKLTSSRAAIVGDEPGITRDRMYHYANWEGKRFEVVDTGGIVPADRDAIPELVFRQAEIAVEEADLILLVVDGRQGVTTVDEELNGFLRATGKEYLLVVNKLDVPSLDGHVSEFFRLGVDRVYPVSSEHSRGLGDLLRDILQRIPEQTETESPGEIRVSIIGRPNMGKSSLLNRLVGADRAIVTDIPGTTRDSIDTVIEYQGQRFRLIDTAGIRRKGKTTQMADKLSVVMARKSIERCDVVLLLIDPTEGATKPDATIGGYAHDAGKSIIVVVNKWDLVEKETDTARRLEAEFRSRMRFLDYAPFVFVSAKTGQRVFKLLEFVQRAYEARQSRISTGELNRFVDERLKGLRVGGGRQGSPVLYASQVGVAPPTLVLFTRTRGHLHFSKERYLVNQLRDSFDFYATPIRIKYRTRRSRIGS